MTTILITALVAGLVAAILMLSTHLLLWRWPWQLTRSQAHIVGTVEIGVVLTGWALLVDHPEAVIGFWAIAGCAGAADLTAGWVRRRLHQLTADTEARAFERGQIVGLPGDAAAPPAEPPADLGADDATD